MSKNRIRRKAVSFKGLMAGFYEGYKNAPPNVAIKILGFFYGLGVSVVNLGYRSGMRRVIKAPLPVVSIGNLTLGGTGKTPVSIFAADYMVDSGKKPAILTRGYGNDECRMLVDELPGVPVYKGQDRVRSALRAYEDDCDIVIMDDGFQHRRLFRDLDVVLVDARSGFGNGYIFPAGPLREPANALKRADIVLITRSDGASPERLKELKDELSELSEGKPIAVSRHHPVFFSDLTGHRYELSELCGCEVFLVCGIADPYHFESMIRKLGAEVKGGFYYPDHHRYTEKDMRCIADRCKEFGTDKIVVTKKDIVKMKALDIGRVSEKIAVLEIKIEIHENGEVLFDRLNSVLRRDPS